jgi:hypothetical protein
VEMPATYSVQVNLNLNTMAETADFAARLTQDLGNRPTVIDFQAFAAGNLQPAVVET